MRWKPEWQNSLSETLQKVQSDLNLNMIVIVAKESDLYSELLYFFSFIGLFVGTSMAVLLHVFNIQDRPHDLAFPVAGFAMGSLLHLARPYFLQHFFSKLANNKAHLKARSYFYEHAQTLQGPMALLYFSEVERAAEILATPEIESKLPKSDIDGVCRSLAKTYKQNDPLSSLRPAIENLGILIRTYVPDSERNTDTPIKFGAPMYVTATDRVIKMIPVLKGNKDIN